MRGTCGSNWTHLTPPSPIGVWTPIGRGHDCYSSAYFLGFSFIIVGSGRRQWIPVDRAELLRLLRRYNWRPTINGTGWGSKAHHPRPPSPATPEEVRISAALDGLRSLSSDRNRPFCWRRPAGGSPVAPGVAAPACRRQNGTDADTRRRRSILDEI